MFALSIDRMNSLTKVGQMLTKDGIMSDLFSNIASNLVTNGISKVVLGNDKVAKTAAAVVEPSKTEKADDFSAVLKSFLPADSTSNVSEEDLFSAAAGERIQNLKGEEGLKKYQAALDSEKKALTASDGYVPMEKATINALKKLVADGVINKEEGDRVYTESFEAAQLDTNKDSLFDGRGDASDPTIAVAKMSEVMDKIKSFVERIGTTPIANEALKSLDSADATGAGSIATTAGVGLSSFVAGSVSSGNVVPQGTNVDGAEGFLFKPITNNEGKLAVMFAQSWTGNILGVRLLDSTGNLIEDGIHKTEGTAETGREKYTFSKQGGDYPNDISVEVTLKDGTVKTYSIPDPSKRYD